jgi:polyisoprenoid-binding protein YceI
MMIQTVHGRFRDFEGLIGGGDDPSVVSIKVASLETLNDERDAQQLVRSDYGLVWNRLLETDGVLVGDVVDLTLDVAAVRVD